MNKDTIEKVSREIQKEFLSYEGKRYALTDIEKVKQSVSAVFEANNLPDLTKNSEFVKENFVELVIEILASVDQQVLAVLVKLVDHARQPDDFRPSADNGDHLKHRLPRALPAAS